MMDFERGDIFLVNFNPAKGGEIGKLRPAIILSDRDACINEITSLSKTRLKEKLAAVTAEELNVIQNALCQLTR